jgi:pimeloyl-ACP methyl ester carboxylesterase
MKWMRRIGLVLVAALALVVLAGIAFEQWSRRVAKSRFIPPGQMLVVDGVDSHLYCTGNGTPTVIFESGLDTDGSLGWSNIQPKVAELTRACSYDRAGIMWSAPRNGVRDARTIANELRALLASASEAPPYVMVGHSLGGPLVRVFAEAVGPDAVQGVVLVDSSHPEQLQRAPVPEGGGPPATLLRVLAATGGLRLLDEDGALGLSEDARLRAAAFAPQSVGGLLGEFQAIEATFQQAGATGSLGDRPLVVLTALDKPPEMLEPWLVLQRELAKLSTNSDQRFVPNCGHYIQHEQPDVVVTAVRDVVRAVRGEEALCGGHREPSSTTKRVRREQASRN